MTEEKVSIIVPVYNAEKTLRRCVESLINQTYMNIEIILVNDGSKDNSLTICREYEHLDSRIIVIDKENGGVSSARNLGLDRAKGDLIAFCDSDDWVENNWIEILLKYYEPDSLVMCGYYSHIANGDVEEIGVSLPVEYIAREDYLTTKLIGGFVPWNKLYERRVIEENGIVFPIGITLGEDKLFIWRYLNHIKGKIICVKAFLNDYNWPSGDSLTLNLPDNYYEQCIQIYNEMKADIDQGNICSDNSIKAFYNDTYLQLECAIRSIFNRKCNLQEKIKLANSIMKNSIYQECVQLADISSNAIARFLCRRKSSYGLLFLKLINKY